MGCWRRFCVMRNRNVPPLILSSWHAPSISAGQETFEQSVDRLQEEIAQMQGTNARITRLVMCGDFNCQFVESPPLVGQYGCTIERSVDSARACHNLGPTRRPWPQAAEKGEQPTVIDFACASSKLQSRVYIQHYVILYLSSRHPP